MTSGFIAARLRAAGSASEKLAAELAEFRLRESDLRRLVVRAERLEGIAEMSGSLAHEIKNPLASIRSAVEQLSRMPRASEDEKILSALVQRESDRLSRVLSEFLDFAKTGMTRIGTLDVTDDCPKRCAAGELAAGHRRRREDRRQVPVGTDDHGGR